MIANLVSLFIASRLQHEPIYEALAVQDGIHLPTGESRQQRGQRRVARVLRPAVESLPADMKIQEALQRVRASKIRSWLITNERGVVGLINLPTLERAADEDDTKKLSAIVDALFFPHVHADQGLDLALDRMGSNHVEILPVVSRADVHKMEGIVTLREFWMSTASTHRVCRKMCRTLRAGIRQYGLFRYFGPSASVRARLWASD